MTKARTLADFNTTSIPASVLTGALPELDGSALTNLPAGGETNSPYFSAKKASDQTITRNTMTDVSGFTDNEIDSDSAFNGTTFTVPSGKAGLYFFSALVTSDFGSIGNDGERMLVTFKKNGSDAGMPNSDFSKASGYNIQRYANTISAVLNLAVGDTINVAVYNKDGDASGNAKVNPNSFFMGFRIKE
tara:strand:+ start:85 stop:651 length:567 start_codon:yes stop_codon:yes gene_type:complete